MNICEFLVIGGGVAGTSAAYFLSRFGKTIVLYAEAESQLGYHTTGRSAAVFAETYGNTVIRGLTSASKKFYFNPPAEFGDVKLVTPRSSLYVGTKDEFSMLDDLFKENTHLGSGIKRLGSKETISLCPVLREEYAFESVYDTYSTDIDVHALTSGFVRGIKNCKSSIVTNSRVLDAKLKGESWIVSTEKETFHAKTIINCSGAWGDVTNEIFGAQKLGLIPKRRTIVSCAILNEKDDQSMLKNVSTWPFVQSISPRWYFKSDGKYLWCSPTDETPQDPGDCVTDDLDIAIAIDRIETETKLKLKPVHSWAGQRTFVKDKSPVVGLDTMVPNYYHCVGQGGYGIQTAFAMGELISSLIIENKVPEHTSSLGVKKEHLSPDRLLPL